MGKQQENQRKPTRKLYENSSRGAISSKKHPTQQKKNQINKTQTGRGASSGTNQKNISLTNRTKSRCAVPTIFIKSSAIQFVLCLHVQKNVAKKCSKSTQCLRVNTYIQTCMYEHDTNICVYTCANVYILHVCLYTRSIEIVFSNQSTYGSYIRLNTMEIQKPKNHYFRYLALFVVFVLCFFRALIFFVGQKKRKKNKLVKKNNEKY